MDEKLLSESYGEENLPAEPEETVDVSQEKSAFKRAFAAMGRTAKKIGTRNLVVAASFLLIGVAVVLNFVLFGNTNAEGKLSPGVDVKDVSGKVDDEDVDAYFASAQLSRKQARDQALAVLQTVVDSASADTTAKEQASTDISRIASEIQMEADIETMIRSKGFEECVAVISENSANIIVRSDGLLPNELSQIKEIVYEKAGIDPLNIKIVEKHAN